MTQPASLIAKLLAAGVHSDVINEATEVVAELLLLRVQNAAIKARQEKKKEYDRRAVAAKRAAKRLGTPE